MGKSILDYILETINKSVFLKNIAVLASGNVLGFAVTIATVPLIGRLYTPAQVGEYDLIVSTGRFITNFLGLGLLIAIMLPRENEKARQICRMVLWLNLFFLAVLLFGFLCLASTFQLFVSSLPYWSALMFLAAHMFFSNLQGIYYAYANRCKEYSILFWNPVLLSTSFAGLAVLFHVVGMGTEGYFLGKILSYVICCVHMGMHINPFTGKGSLQEWKNIFMEYRGLTLFQMPANILGTAAKELPMQLLGRFLGAEVLGGYMMAVRILGLPVNLLASPVNRVVYQTMAERVNRGEDIGAFCFHLIKRNIQIAMVPLLILVISVHYIVPFFLGESWTVVADYVILLGPVHLLQFCSACLSGTFVVMGKSELSIVCSSVHLILYGIVFFTFSSMDMNSFQAIFWLTCCECIYQFFNLFLCTWCTKYSIREFLLFFITYIVGGNLLIYAIYFLLRSKAFGMGG